jgi:hypothetical protein
MDASGGNRLLGYHETSSGSPEFKWEAKVASDLDINLLWIKDRVSAAGEDVVFGCSKPFGASANTAIQVFRVKVGSTHALSDLRGYTLGAPGDAGLTCNSIRAISDTQLFVNVETTSTNTLVLCKVTLDEGVSTSVSYERRVYLPTLSSSMPLFPLRTFIKPLSSGQLEPEIIFGGSDPWSFFADQVQALSGITSIAWVHSTLSTKSYLDPFTFSRVASGGSGGIALVFTLT